ncbi:MAG: hypothetical protein P9L94_14580 [Candidatus Hinthialibacter antarcticus]|nr:hypothetical protein [Candidatus Hinthialibacter antarcticus]
MMAIISRSILCLCIAMLVPNVGYCDDDAYWRYWTVTDGLASSRCKTITINDNQSVWIGNGLHHYMSGYDGFNIDRFINPMISTIPIAAGVQDDLWMKSFDGLKHYENGSWEDHSIHQFSQAIDFAPYDDMKLLILTENQLWDYDVVNSQRTFLLEVENTQMGRFLELSKRIQDTIWIGCEAGLIRVDLSNGPQQLQISYNEFKSNLSELLNYHSLNITQSDDVIAVANTILPNFKTIIRFSQKKFESIYEFDDNIYEAWQDEKQRIWFYNGFNLYRIENNQLHEIEKKGPLVGELYDMEVELDSSFWIASSEGLVRYSPPLWETPDEISHINNWVHAIREDRKQRVWFLSNKDLMCIDEGKWKIFPLPDGYTSHRYETEDLCLFPDGRLVMNTNNFSEFLVFDPQSESFEFIHHPENIGIRIMSPSKDGRIWVRMETPGEPHFWLSLYDGVEFTPYTLASGEPLQLDRVRCVNETSSGDIWIGCLTSVGVIQNGEYREWANEIEFPGVSALYINEIPNGEVWVGDRNNIFSYSNGVWSTVAADIDAVRSILVDDDSVWIASTSGIYRYFENALVQHDQNDGLVSTITYKVYKDSQSRLWAGTALGVSQYFAAHDPDSPITIVNEDSNPSQFSHTGEARILFSGIDKWKYTDHSRLLFSYRLNGGAWTPYSHNTVASFHSTCSRSIHV